MDNFPAYVSGKTSTPKISPEPYFPELVDSTMMAAFDGCEKRFWYSFMRRIASLGISPDLHAGGAFSRGLEATRKHFYGRGEQPQTAIIFGARALMEFYGDFEPPVKRDGTYSTKNLANTLAAFEDYFREYPLERDEWQPLRLSDGTPCVEFTFSIPTNVLHPITKNPILYGGRADMIAQHIHTGLLAGCDEKTMGKTPNEQWVKSLPMRGQFLGYTYAMREHGYDIQAFLVRGVGILKTKTTHLQSLEQFSNQQLEKWWLNLNVKLTRMVQSFERNYWELSFGDACTSYYGCEFLQLCQAIDDEELMAFYQHREWNPLQKDPTWPKDGPVYEKVTLEGLKIR